MLMTEQQNGLNKAQMDILRLLGHIKTEEEAAELRQVISNFYAKKAEDAMDRLWETGLWDEEKNDWIPQYRDEYGLNEKYQRVVVRRLYWSTEHEAWDAN